LYIWTSGLDHKKKMSKQTLTFSLRSTSFSFSLVIIRPFFCLKYIKNKLVELFREVISSKPTLWWWWWWWSIPEGVCFFFSLSLSFSSVYKIYIWCKNDWNYFQLNKIIRLLQSFFSYVMTDMMNLVELSKKKKEECLYL
jgi:hypothetical protein